MRWQPQPVAAACIVPSAQRRGCRCMAGQATAPGQFLASLELPLTASRYIVLLSAFAELAGHRRKKMAPDPDLRIGDAERDAAAERLREGYAQGRLTLDEFNERLPAAMAARTDRELRQLTQDLPQPVTASPPLPQSAPGDGWQRSGHDHHHGTHQHGTGRRRLFPLLAAVALVWLLISVSPLALFPVPGKLAILLVVLGVLRGVFRRIFGGRR